MTGLIPTRAERASDFEDITVQITVYGKHGCGKCEAAREKLLRLGYVEGTEWTYYDCTDLQSRWESGEDTSAVTDAMSALQMIASEDQPMPAIDIDGRVHTYPEAMRALKALRRTK